VSKQESKIIEGVRPYLDPGEEPLVAIVAQPKGTTAAVAGRGAMGVGGGLMGSRQRRDAHDAATAAGLVLEAPCAVVLTTHRLMTVKIGAPIGLGLGGKFKEVLSWVPVTDVASVEVKKVALRQNVTIHVNGASITLEANAAASAKELASTVAAMRG
jgi:hypothetical protein